MVQRILPTLALALVLAGCGSTAALRTTPTTTTTTAQKTICRKTTHAIARLNADIAALRRAARLPTKDALRGNAPVNAATDRFLNDVALAPIGNLRRNRMIDHAMGTLAGACEQCFQALEAARPVVNIRRGERGC